MEKLEQEVKETIETYKLIKGKEKVAVALSGGKDSTTTLHILKKLGYNVHGLMIDLYLGQWSETHKKNMTTYCKEQNIPLTIIDIKKELGQGICFIKMVLKKKKGLTGCTVCGIIKRWLLNKGAKRIGAKKLATGHNLDDEAQNVLMNYLKGNILLGANSSPATGGKQIKGFVQRIKPLFYTAETDIKKYAEQQQFNILYDKCPCAFGTYRVDTRNWMKNTPNKQKKMIVKNFQKIIPQIRKENKKEIYTCTNCNEPARDRLCNACKIFAEL